MTYDANVMQQKLNCHIFTFVWIINSLPADQFEAVNSHECKFSLQTIFPCFFWNFSFIFPHEILQNGNAKESLNSTRFTREQIINAGYYVTVIKFLIEYNLLYIILKKKKCLITDSTQATSVAFILNKKKAARKINMHEFSN